VIRIGAVRGDAQELAVSRTVKNAEVVRFEGWPATMAALIEGRIEAVAGNRVTLPATAREFPGSQILDDAFGKQQLVLFVPKKRQAALGHVQDFVKQANGSQHLRQALLLRRLT
jgi:ABC-type amino acid transport substrate-binding protein